MEEHPAQGRECGDCHVCCDLLTTDRARHRNAADRRCPNYARERGCLVPDGRPPACASWHCAWHEFAWLPDLCRPDRMGILLTVEQGDTPAGEPYVLARTPDVSNYKSLLAQDVLWQLVQQMPVRVEVGRKQFDYGAPGRAINPRFL